MRICSDKYNPLSTSTEEFQKRISAIRNWRDKFEESILIFTVREGSDACLKELLQIQKETISNYINNVVNPETVTEADSPMVDLLDTTTKMGRPKKNAIQVAKTLKKDSMIAIFSAYGYEL